MKQFCLAFTLIFLASSTEAVVKTPAGLDKIGHIIVIYLENHSFDNLYGNYPNPEVEGLSKAKPERTLQTDREGKLYAQLPQVSIKDKLGHKSADPRFPPVLPNRPFAIDALVQTDDIIPDLSHGFYQHQQQINQGRMDRFAAISFAGGLTMGYFKGPLPLWDYARRFTLADHFFQAAFGGSFINHQWLICACTPRYENAPAAVTAALAPDGQLLTDGPVSPDGFAVNTIEPKLGPHAPGIREERLLPPQTAATIGDRLSEKGVDWAWYSGGWNDAEAGIADRSFQYHHQPFAFYARYAPGKAERGRHLKDLADLLAGLERGQLPPVVFYKPIGSLNEHPGYAELQAGERHVAWLLDKIEHSPMWKDSVVIVTYDEYGGFWDHLPPPVVDRWGPGSRIPALVISPFANGGQIDHTVYDTTSILKLIENRHHLKPLSRRDAEATSLERALKL